MKIKRIINLLILLCFSCSNTNTNKMADNKLYYAINYDTNIPYEIFINGISIARSYNLKGQEGGYRILNPFIEKNGIQNMSIIFFLNDSIHITKDFLSRQNFEIYTFDNIDNPTKITLLKKIEMNINSATSIVTTNFESNISYSLSQSLENAVDLTKIDSTMLLKECQEFYIEAADIINKGNIEKYKELISNSITRETVSLYYNETEKQEFLNKLDNKINNSKGFLKDIKNYKLKIHPNKKIVSLVDEDGNTPLIFSDNKKENKFSFLLYKPNFSSPLKAY